MESMCVLTGLVAALTYTKGHPLLFLLFYFVRMCGVISCEEPVWGLGDEEAGLRSFCMLG